MPFDGRGRLSKVLKVYFLAVTLGLTASFTNLRFKYVSDFIASQLQVQKIHSLASVTVGMVLVISNMAHVVQCLRKRTTIESVLQKVTYKSSSRYNIIDCAVMVLGATAQGAFIYLRDQVPETRSPHYRLTDENLLIRRAVVMTVFWANLTNFTTVMQFVSIAGALTGRLNDLTAHLRIRKEFRESRFLECMTAAKLLNESYKWQITLTLVHLWGFCVTHVYICLSEWMVGGTEALMSRSWYYGVSTVLAVTRFVTLWMMNDRPHRLNQAAEAFNNELFKMMRSNKELCRDRKLFLYVTKRQTFKFNACGFFNLGYPLLTSIIAAATTYLVILLQFSM